MVFHPRFFDCGTHKCSKPCHVPAFKPTPCPRTPSIATHCPCGKHEISPSEAPFFSPGSNLIRVTCKDPIPTCTSLCLRQLDYCSHTCSSPCHTGPCPPCRIKVVRSCRCGATTQDVDCHGDQSGEYTEIVCDRPCPALRSCGKHQCKRNCCPLASLPGIKGKGKKRVEEDPLDEYGWHICDLVCKKQLPCGNHTCEERDHKGHCPPCLRSSFEEVVLLSCSWYDLRTDWDLQKSCHCNRTVLAPPIPCGTKIFCSFSCNRPPPPCGHRKHPHLCHEDPSPCPPCSFLTSKRCACGKKMVENVTCSREKVLCGTPCGKLVFPIIAPVVSFLRWFLDSLSAASTGVTECVTLTTVGRVKIPAESHGSYGKSNTEFIGILSSIPTVVLPSIPVRIRATLQAPVRRRNLVPQW